MLIRACGANRRSTASNVASRCAGSGMRRTAGSRAVVAKPTPPIHSTIARTCSARAIARSSIAAARRVGHRHLAAPDREAQAEAFRDAPGANPEYFRLFGRAQRGQRLVEQTEPDREMVGAERLREPEMRLERIALVAAGDERQG